RATRPSSLEAIAVAVDAEETTELRRQWDTLEVPVPLTVLDSPYREETRPVVEFVKTIRRTTPRDLVVVYVPEYVVGHWWERVVLLRRAIHGERVRARLTGTRKKGHWRAETVDVLDPAPQRVPTVWPEAGPGGVGGGELGHVSLPGQLDWKRSVVDDALARIA